MSTFLELPNHINTLEKEKFDLNDDGEVIVRTQIAGGNINAVPSGLRTALRTTTLQISTTAIKLPATPLANRNSISIFNKSETETIYIGQDNTVTADTVAGVTSGWEIPPLGTLNVDITDEVELWGITTGTFLIKILELA